MADEKSPLLPGGEKSSPGLSPAPAQGKSPSPPGSAKTSPATGTDGTDGGRSSPPGPPRNTPANVSDTVTVIPGAASPSNYGSAHTSPQEDTAATRTSPQQPPSNSSPQQPPSNTSPNQPASSYGSARASPLEGAPGGVSGAGEESRKQDRLRLWLRCLAFTLLFLLGVGAGFAGGWLGRERFERNHNISTPFPKERVLSELSANNIRHNLQRFTLTPHVAGSANDQKLTDDIEAMWKDQGLDFVKQEQYRVLMSYPNHDDPSRVTLRDASGNTLFQSQIQEKNLTSDQNNPDIVIPYGAYSPPGDVTAPLVFVNYGRIEDFQRLVTELGGNCTGKIAIVKYGKIFRADKVTFASEFGCAGVILYSDPADYNPGPQQPFPHSWWLPDTGVQRGTMYTSKGDPLTPGYPATESAYRWPEDKVDGLPKIPVHVISYGDASILLGAMGGEEAPADWQGALQLTYRLGGEMQDSKTVNLRVTTSNQMVNTSNVLGFIRGAVEPDRYVLLGNHRDAWVFGGIDPNTGTAVMMEVSRAFARLLKEGIRPRRTIIFCSWGAEEPGLIGSTEWVENYIKNLGSRAVVYINMDSAVSGNSTFQSSAVPLLYEAVYEATGQVQSPNDEKQTMYDEWLAVNPAPNDTTRPTIGALGAGSDHAAFINIAGVSSVDVSYKFDPKLGLSSTPCYHSAYETFYLFSTFVDPEFKYSLAMARVVSVLLVEFADVPLLRILNASQYYRALNQDTRAVEKEHGAKFSAQGIHLDALKNAVLRFGYSVMEFEKHLKNVNTDDELAVRKLNDQFMQLERAFLDPHGVPQQPIYKHLISAPSKFNSYEGSAFPGLANLLFDIDSAPNKEERWEEVRRHLAAITFVIESAASVLAPVNAFNLDPTYFG